MSEQQIKSGYERLDGALAPPRDAAERVGRRVAVRRRRRRAAVVGSTALVLVASVGTALTLSGGDDPGGDRIAVDPPAGPQSTLVMTRPDGSTYAFPDVEVSCEPPPAVRGEVRPAEGRIWLWSPMDFVGEPGSNDARVNHPFVYFEGIVTKIEGDRTLELPVDGPGGSESYPMTVFIADSQGEDGNEVASSAGGETAGTVRILEASCDPTPVLRLEIDATLGSEEGKTPIDLAGAVR